MTSSYHCNTPVAILMAAYNAEKYISEQIDSILTQTSSDWTLYIRNDGSTDDTQRIIDKYVSANPNKIIQIDRGGANLGCNKNFYRLLESVDADYYMFSDADDVWLPEKVERALNKIKSYESQFINMPILVHNDMIICDSNLNIIAPSLWEKEKLNPERFHSFSMLLVAPNVGGATSIFNSISKKYIFPVPSDNRIYFDHWISLTTAKHGKIFADKFPALKYRQHENQQCGIQDSHGDGIISNLYKRIKHLNYDAQLFKCIGVNSVSFYYYKVIRCIRKLYN